MFEYVMISEWNHLWEFIIYFCHKMVDKSPLFDYFELFYFTSQKKEEYVKQFAAGNRKFNQIQHDNVLSLLL